MMGKVEQEQIAAEIREQNELYEAGDTDRAFWLGQQKRLKALQNTEPKLTQPQMGKMVGKSHAWVKAVLGWDGHSSVQSPFARDASPSRGEGVSRAEARRVLKDKPESVVPEIAEALERPEVRKAVVKAMKPGTRQHVTRQVSEQTAADAAEVETYVPDEASMDAQGMMATLREARRRLDFLATHISRATQELLEQLERVGEFREEYGDIEFKAEDPGEESFTLNELLDQTLEQEEGKVAIAFAAARGVPDHP
jgi:hypothetical protein